MQIVFRCFSYILWSLDIQSRWLGIFDTLMLSEKENRRLTVILKWRRVLAVSSSSWFWLRNFVEWKHLQFMFLGGFVLWIVMLHSLLLLDSRVWRGLECVHVGSHEYVRWKLNLRFLSFAHPTSAFWCRMVCGQCKIGTRLEIYSNKFKGNFRRKPYFDRQVLFAHLFPKELKRS